jgi:hypothetical protein
LAIGEFALPSHSIQATFTFAIYNFPVLASRIDQWPESR